MTQPPGASGALPPPPEALDICHQNTLNQIFAMDPLDITNQDLDVLVAALREHRKKIVSAEALPKSRRGKVQAPEINLAQLNLE